ncbi:MAG TPA: hypothetical protein VGG46_10850 [Terriglobales bacterium]
MTQAFQLLTVVAVACGLACYGFLKGRKEREREQRHSDPRQQSLFPSHSPARHEDRELVAR